MYVRNRAFTLVELLVVVAIISMLAVVITTGLLGFREGAILASCGQSLRGAGMEYFQNHHDLDQFGLGAVSIPEEPEGAAGQKMPPPCPWCKPGGEPPEMPSVPDSGLASTVLNQNGKCPNASANAMYGIDPLNQPRVRSFGISERVASGRDWVWMIADSDFQTVAEREELASDRHAGRINVFFKDGNVAALPASEVAFPGEKRP